MANAPCYHCESRKLDCHSSCDKYKAFKRDLPSTAFVKEEAREYRREAIGKNLKRYRYRREKQGRSPY